MANGSPASYALLSFESTYMRQPARPGSPASLTPLALRSSNFVPLAVHWRRMIGAGLTVSCSAELSDAEERVCSWTWPKLKHGSAPAPIVSEMLTAPSPNVPAEKLVGSGPAGMLVDVAR